MIKDLKQLYDKYTINSPAIPVGLLGDNTMNNVTNMFGNTTAMDSIRANGYGDADFDIATAPLMYLNAYESSKSVVYRTDNNQELGVHGDRYVPVAPKNMIEATRKILERSDLNLNGITESISMSHGGGRTYVKYNLPEHTYLTPDGDTATLQLLGTTSLDSTWPFMISVGAIQSACLNMQVFTSGNVALYRSKHMKGLDIDHGSNVIIKCLDIFENQREQWAEWYKQPVSSHQAFKLFAETVGWKGALEYMKENPDWIPQVVINSVRRNKNFDYIWSRHMAHYTKKFGHSFWAAYNSLTDWSSHAPSSKRSDPANRPAVLAKRSEVVRTAVTNWSKAA